MAELATMYIAEVPVAALDNKYCNTTLSNGHGSEVVSALRFERLGPEFRFPVPVNPIFLPRIKIKE